jgi:hypothetical protein
MKYKLIQEKPERMSHINIENADAVVRANPEYRYTVIIEACDTLLKVEVEPDYLEKPRIYVTIEPKEEK